MMTRYYASMGMTTTIVVVVVAVVVLVLSLNNIDAQLCVVIAYLLLEKNPVLYTLIIIYYN